jgi:serine/threonine protein kinase
LVKGINAKDEYIVKRYNEMDFFGNYSKAKKDYWTKKGKSLDTLERMTKEEKKIIRRGVHKEMTEILMNELDDMNISKYSIDIKYIDNIEISLADFGTHCEEGNYYDEPFGTRYYMAPEIILMGKCSYPVDIWAIGCTYYEMLTGNILFDPIKCKNHSRDYYHLCLINETCGKFPPKMQKNTKYGSHYLNYDGIVYDYDIGSMDRLECKLRDMDGVVFIKQLIKEMIEIDPFKRITADKLLSKIG